MLPLFFAGCTEMPFICINQTKFNTQSQFVSKQQGFNTSLRMKGHHIPELVRKVEASLPLFYPKGEYQEYVRTLNISPTTLQRIRVNG